MPLCSALYCRNRGSHVFPKDPIRRKQWESALRRKNFKASASARLCNSHFKEEDFITESIWTGCKPLVKWLKKSAIPSIFNFEKQDNTPISRVQKRIQSKLQSSSSGNESEWDKIEIEIDTLSPNDTPECTTSQHMSPDHFSDSTFEVECEETEYRTDDGLSTQFSSKSTEIDRDYMYSSKSTQYNRECTVSTKSTQINREHMFGSIYRFENDDQAIQFYTGFETYKQFQCAYATLHPLVHKIKYYKNNVLHLATENQFFLTLMKLKQNKCNFELSRFFNISITSVANIFITWVNFIYQVWSEISNWPTELVECYMPVSLKKFDKRFFNTESKLLAYCSQAYKTSITDGQEVELCKIMAKCQNRESLYAGEKSNGQGSSQSHLKTIVNLTRNHKILQGVGSRSLPLYNKIFFLCFMCCSFLKAGDTHASKSEK